MAPDTKCNLIFIDGGHSYGVAKHDLENMRSLANSSFHRVLLDDSDIPEVRRAWEDLVEANGIHELSSKIHPAINCMAFEEDEHGFFEVRTDGEGCSLEGVKESEVRVGTYLLN